MKNKLLYGLLSWKDFKVEGMMEIMMISLIDLYKRSIYLSIVININNIILKLIFDLILIFKLQNKKQI
jgi:hypothetical protein